MKKKSESGIVIVVITITFFMSEKQEKRAFISIDEWLDDNKRFNLNIAVGLMSFSTMVFHFAAVYFFTFKLGSLLMVWIFLGLWNFFAFLFDVPISILQSYFKSKTLLWFWAIAQMFAMLIFANFIFGTTDFLAWEIAWTLDWIELLWATTQFFLGDVTNWLLLVFAALCYWFNREINDITFLSYILSQANPSQYKKIIAQKNLFFGIWSLLWLVLSWVILSFNPKLIVIYILFIVIAIAFVSLKFFDSKDKIINLADIKKYKVYFDKNWLNKAKSDITDNFEEKKDSLVQSVRSVELKEVLWTTKYIFMKPVTLKNQMLPLWELADQTRNAFIDIFKTLIYAKSSSLIVYWSFIMVLIFGFWDTFASTFLLEFLDQVKSGWSYILLWIIAIPAFALQDPFWRLADKVWVYKIANLWLAISWISLIIMAFFSTWESWELNFPVLLSLAIANSIGYAICMSLSVAVFLESYNKTFALKNKLTQIDSNASAAPMKILQNLAYVVWLVFGWFILWIAWYPWFFAIFGILILVFLGWSILKGKEVKS